ncbi:TetR/AcrR family transcriptional regulator [Rathayibacter soli]|uniref:TetR/AcrR family transcriptional regulator n=1 Tax=Rathayibacter soli TaxID=3144168 RepID=UPI0027E49525|nr:TetR/AcrR family transcriptional regulator [Glaciibacter superstes]
MVEQDRRVRRTRKALHETFISLVLEKGYDQLTVQDILDRADIGRSTFYAHYRDKEALLTACFDGVREQLTSEFDALTTAGLPIEVYRPAELIFDHAYRNQRIYRAICGRNGGGIVLRYLHTLIVDVLLEHLRRQANASVSGDRVADSTPDEVAAEFYAAATVGLLAWWIDQDFARDPRSLATDFRRLAGRGAAVVADAHSEQVLAR